MKILTHVNMAPIESLEVLMRGLQDKQTSMWAFVSIEERIPIEHPLRRIKKLADQQLVKLHTTTIFPPLGLPRSNAAVLRSKLWVSTVKSFR